MKHNVIIAGLVGAAALVGSSVVAAQALDSRRAVAPPIADLLDQRPPEYAMTAAKRRRLMMIQETMRQQRLYDRGYYGYPARRGYGPRPGYGYGHGGYHRHDPRW